MDSRFEGRWRQQHKTELDGDSVDYDPLGANRSKKKKKKKISLIASSGCSDSAGSGCHSCCELCLTDARVILF